MRELCFCGPNPGLNRAMAYMRLWKVTYISIAAEPRDTANASALLICALTEMRGTLH
jgi:hypothetical protein